MDFAYLSADRPPGGAAGGHVLLRQQRRQCGCAGQCHRGQLRRVLWASFGKAAVYSHRVRQHQPVRGLQTALLFFFLLPSGPVLSLQCFSQGQGKGHKDLLLLPLRCPEKTDRFHIVDGANDSVKEFCSNTPNHHFIDINPCLFAADGDAAWSCLPFAPCPALIASPPIPLAGAF